MQYFVHMTRMPKTCIMLFWEQLFQVWVDACLLPVKKWLKSKIKSSCFAIPADCGQLLSNISSSYGSFTAAQWRNWITVYSLVVLKGLLPVEHLQCWLLFVKALPITLSTHYTGFRCCHY